MKESPEITSLALFKERAMADDQRNETCVGTVLTDTANLDIRRKSHPFIHSDKTDNGSIYCLNCQHIVCEKSECKHSNHETVKLREAAMINKVKLSAAVLKVRGLIMYSHIVIKDLQCYLDKIGTSLAEMTAEVLERADNLQEEGADLLVQTVVNDIENERESERIRIHTKIEQFEQFIINAKSHAVKCEQLSISKEDRTVVTEGRKQLLKVLGLEKCLPECPVERCLYMITPLPQGAEIQTFPPEQIIGEFTKVLVPWRLEVKRIASFRPDKVASARFVTTMCPAEDGLVWVVWQWGPLIHAVDKEGNVMHSVDAGSKVDDICIDKDGNLIIACHESKCIKFLNSNHEIIRTINLEKVPRGVQIASRNELVACCVQNLHHRNGDVSNVVKIRTDGQENESDNTINVINKENTLVQPWRVAVNNNGDVCVSDRNRGAVIIFDNQGEVKAVYNGPETSTRHAFAPHAISCDKYGQIFVVDYTNHTVHVLDPLGRFRGFLIMDTELEKRAIFMGTSSPFSITIDSIGDIWVGNKFGYLTVLKYML